MSRSRSTVRRSSTFAAQAVPGIVHDVLRSGGEPLSTPVRAHMESRFGRDFSQVRVHADERAAEASEAVDARAFTAGRSIVFGAGEYQPETGPGRMLLAHELAHVVQQGASTEAPTRIGASSDPAEREAHGAAQGFALGGPVAVAPSSSPPSVQRQESRYKPYFWELMKDAERMRRALGGRSVVDYRLPELKPALRPKPAYQPYQLPFSLTSRTAGIANPNPLDVIYNKGVVGTVRKIVDPFGLSSGAFVSGDAAMGNFDLLKTIETLRKSTPKTAEPAPQRAVEPAPPQDAKPVGPEQTDAEIDATWYLKNRP